MTEQWKVWKSETQRWVGHELDHSFGIRAEDHPHPPAKSSAALAWWISSLRLWAAVP